MSQTFHSNEVQNTPEPRPYSVAEDFLRQLEAAKDFSEIVSQLRNFLSKISPVQRKLEFSTYNYEVLFQALELIKENFPAGEEETLALDYIKGQFYLDKLDEILRPNELEEKETYLKNAVLPDEYLQDLLDGGEWLPMYELATKVALRGRDLNKIAQEDTNLSWLSHFSWLNINFVTNGDFGGSVTAETIDGLTKVFQHCSQPYIEINGGGASFFGESFTQLFNLFEEFQLFDRVKSLDFTRIGINHQMWQIDPSLCWEKFTSLEELKVVECFLEDINDLVSIVNCLQSLKKLAVDQEAFTDKFVARLARLDKELPLEEVGYPRSAPYQGSMREYLTANGLNCIAQSPAFKNLKSLRIPSLTLVEPSNILTLLNEKSVLKQLEHLDISGIVSGNRRYGSMRALDYLNAVLELSSINLKRLDFAFIPRSSTQYHVEDFPLQNPSQQQRRQFSLEPGSDLEKVTQMPGFAHLESLDLSNHKLSKECITAIAEHGSNLRKLDLSLHHSQSNRSPENPPSFSITDILSGLEEGFTSNLQNLRELSLSAQSVLISNETWEWTGNPESALYSLEKLDLSLSRLGMLSSFDVDGTEGDNKIEQFFSAFFGSIAGLPTLKHLNLDLNRFHPRQFLSFLEKPEMQAVISNMNGQLEGFSMRRLGSATEQYTYDGVDQDYYNLQLALKEVFPYLQVDYLRDGEVRVLQRRIREAEETVGNIIDNTSDSAVAQCP